MFDKKVCSFVILLICLGRLGVYASLSDDEIAAVKKESMPLLEECLKDRDMTWEDIKKLDGKPNDDFYCFMACFLKKTGTLDENNKFDPEKVSETARRVIKDEDTLAKIDEVSKGCVKVNDEKVEDADEACGKAKLLHECLKKYREIMV